MPEFLIRKEAFIVMSCKSKISGVAYVNMAIFQFNKSKKNMVFPLEFYCLSLFPFDCISPNKTNTFQPFDYLKYYKRGIAVVGAPCLKMHVFLY